jgi:hypothetical protein
MRDENAQHHKADGGKHGAHDHGDDVGQLAELGEQPLLPEPPVGRTERHFDRGGAAAVLQVCCHGGVLSVHRCGDDLRPAERDWTSARVRL